jgi:hypothetical protein
MKTYGTVEVQLHTPVTLALDGQERIKQNMVRYDKIGIR